ncbi:MAG: peptide deformylase [Coriobacteriales bacterium]
MIRPIMKKRSFLQQASTPATAADAAVARDLADTLETHRAGCVGMAANMIGKLKRIIAVIDDDGSILVMLNPEIIRRGGPHITREGCLSLPGTREAVRYERITVAYDDELMQRAQRDFSGHIAQAIQHEIDHCDGALI